MTIMVPGTDVALLFFFDASKTTLDRLQQMQEGAFQTREESATEPGKAKDCPIIDLEHVCTEGAVKMI